MSSDTYEFDVPMAWVGIPWAVGAFPTGWLGPDLSVVGPDEPRLRFRFRLFPTGREESEIQRRIDHVNGGPRNTVALDNAVSSQWLYMLRKLELAVYGDTGRPRPATLAEAKEQDRLIDEELASETYDDDRAMLQRGRAQQERSRQVAEWAVLIVNPPPAPLSRDGSVVQVADERGRPGAMRPATWADLADLEMHPRVMEAALQAQERARREQEGTAGKAPRSGS